MLATITDYAERVRQGKLKEASIIDALRGAGFKLTLPTPYEDIKFKVDGWIIDDFGERHPLQIKLRENGDDIIFEITKDLDLNLTGRDMLCRSEYYFVVDSHGMGRLFLTGPIKRFATKVEEIVKNDLSVNAKKEFWRGRNGWEAKITRDRASGNKKLMGYFATDLFVAIRSLKCG